MKTHWILLSVMAVAFAAASAPAAIDGSLADWGITVVNGPSGATPGTGGTNYGSLHAPTQVVGTAQLLGTPHIEDTNDVSNSYTVGPNSGGQNYDAEFLGVAYNPFTDKLIIGILSGQRPDNGSNLFAPGDIRIVTDKGVYGVEVGGREPLSGLSQINKGDVGTTYRLDTNGYTVGGVNSNATSWGNIGSNPPATPFLTNDMNPLQTAGSVWKTSAVPDSLSGWILDPIPPATPTQYKIQFSGGTQVGVGADSSYIYKFLTNGQNQHAVIEVELDWSDFFGAGSTLQSVTWSPSCGNDYLTVAPDASPQMVPEACSLLVWGGLATVAFVGWRRRRVQ